MSQSHGKPSEAQGASGNPRAVTRPAVWDRRAAPAGATRKDRASWEGRGWGRQQTRGRGRALLPVGAQPARAAGAQGRLLTHQRVTEPANERSERQGPGCRLYSSPGTTVGRRAPVCSWKGFQHCSHLEGRLEEETGSRRQAAPPPSPPDHRLREGFTAAPGRGWRVAKYQEPRRGGRCPPLRLQSSPVPRSSGRCRVPSTSFSCPVVRPGTQGRAEQGRLEQAPCLALPRWVKRSVRRH